MKMAELTNGDISIHIFRIDENEDAGFFDALTHPQESQYQNLIQSFVQICIESIIKDATNNKETFRAHKIGFTPFLSTEAEGQVLYMVETPLEIPINNRAHFIESIKKIVVESPNSVWFDVEKMNEFDYEEDKDNEFDEDISCEEDCGCPYCPEMKENTKPIIFPKTIYLEIPLIGKLFDFNNISGKVYGPCGKMYYLETDSIIAGEFFAPTNKTVESIKSLPVFIEDLQLFCKKLSNIPH